MARATSTLFATLRGPLGGITCTASSTQALVLRARVGPGGKITNRRTDAQVAFGSATTRWSVLSAEERSRWDDYAKSLSISNATSTFTPKGREIFQRNISYYQWLKNQDVVPGFVITTAPTIPGAIALTKVSILSPTAGNTGFRIRFGWNEANDIYCISMISPAYGQTVNSSRGVFKRETITGTLVVGVGESEVSYYNLIEGKVYFALLKAVTHNQPTRTSSPFTLRIIAETTPP